MSVVLGDKTNFDGSLVAQKIRGGLTYPSSDVVRITTVCEQVFRAVTNFKKKNILPILVTQVLKNFIGSNIFCDLTTHMFDSNVESNHFVLLLKTISEEYFNVRLHFVTKHKKKKDLRHFYIKLL